MHSNHYSGWQMGGFSVEWTGFFRYPVGLVIIQGCINPKQGGREALEPDLG